MDLSGPAPFADTGAEVIARTVQVTLENHADTEAALEIFYELDRSVERIQQVGASRVALQFPDEWLPDAARVAQALEARLDGVQVVILADTSYGACCVDEVAASHADAQMVIHYGRSCLSPTQNLPVLYVFGREEVDVDRAASALLEARKGLEEESTSTCQDWLLTGDVQYAWALEGVAASLRTLLPDGANVYPAHIPKEQLLFPHSTPRKDEEEVQAPCCSGNKEGEAVILFLGAEGPTLSNLMITHGQYPTLSYDPATDRARKEALAVNRTLMRRYYLVQKVKDADVIGIVVGTLGVASYMRIIEHLKGVIRAAGRKSYLFVMGKLNVAKMANFPDVDAFVLVACPETSLVDSKEYLKPIVTPYELELALVRGKEWTGRYVTDFHTVLLEAESTGEDQDKGEDEDDDDDERPHFSLITGQFKDTRRYQSDASNNEALVSSLMMGSEGQVSVRNKETALALLSSPATERLQAREFRGLEQRLGETEVADEIAVGRKGIARGYDHEKE
ncbi:diphthamide biosynthesis protein [Piptocephalis cylindrospora]|uniref:2-(3-amino-3-carboxypropyl)histidine synthase subunit 2 n=1 Tax=Piptocephalis cylindrospora TaxID=1907219 RepID=A0A4P9Y0S5_9FUNG|nr:diphthamide biosynthesis protein [Piptocephalis cylindrospora]|eukprot:RKP12337.1 diphthamide biosynthesis protein [Piptocephalis cylindrospora]